MADQQKTIGPINIPEAPLSHNARLNGSEIAQLWVTYMQYTMLTCVCQHFAQTVEDQSIKNMITESLSRFDQRIKFVADSFQKENIPIPMGFTDQDLNLNAPRLFSDIYVLHYIRNLIRVTMTMNAFNINMSTRPDIRDFYASVLESIIKLNTQITDFMLAKGILPRPPYVTLSSEVEHVHQPKFLAGFFKEKRPLLSIELAHLYHNALANEVGRVLLLGFRQVSPSKEVREYFERGIELADSMIYRLQQVARDDDFSLTFASDEDISDSTAAPFSEKLMMFQTYYLNTIGAGMYGVSAATSARHDIMAMYAQFMTETGLYAERGAKIMMANDWMEEPPQLLDREKLAEYKH